MKAAHMTDERLNRAPAATRDDEAPPDPPDAVLVERSRAGDIPAYEELVRRHRSRIYGLIYNMTSHREDTEDLVQSVFVKAYRSLDRFRGQSAFSTWIYRIALNETLNFLPKRRRRMTLSLNDLDQGVERNPDYIALVARESPFRDVQLSELQKRLNAALQTLSEAHRTVVVLHDIEGLPHDEISRIVGVPEGTVRSRLFHARQQLQTELAEFAP